MSHTPQSYIFVTKDGAVMANGGSTRLGKGQFGIVDKGAAPTTLGQVVTNTFSATPKDRLFQLALGSADLVPGRFQTNKSWRSLPFKLSEVVSISASGQKLDESVDRWYFGYDGYDANKAIVLQNGQTEIIDITLEGTAFGFLGYSDSKVVLKMYLTAPNEGAFTMQQIVEEAVERLKKERLIGGVPVTDYINIATIDSTKSATVAGVDSMFYHLTVENEGRQSDLGLVQSQYPLYKVVQTDYDLSSKSSVYTIVAPVGTVLSDFSIVKTSVVDSDCDGVPEPTNTTVTVAWEEGNTCTAIYENYTLQLADQCDSNRLSELQAYYPELNILLDTPNQVQTVNLTGTSGTGNIIVNGVEYLATFATDLATTEGNFVTAHAAAILTATGATVTYAGGLITFTAPAGTMPIISFDNVSGDLAGTVSALASSGTTNSALCQTKYRTQVISNLVCEDCDPMLRASFVTEAPARFEYIDWVKETKVYDENALMGIMIEGKFNKLAGSEEYRDEMPYIFTSPRISIANYAPHDTILNYELGVNGRIALKLVSKAVDPILGKDLMVMEEQSRNYFSGENRYPGNNFANYMYGRETMLKPFAPYVLYTIGIRTVRPSQSFQGEKVESVRYNIAVEYGKHANVETLVNALATATGLDTVTPY